MPKLQELLTSGRVQLSDRREHPRFRFRGPIEVIAVDVVGAIVPTDIAGWTADISAVGAVITVQKRLTNKGLFIRFAQTDSLVMPAAIIRTITEQSGFYTYAVEFASSFDNDQLLEFMSFSEQTKADADRVAQTTESITA